MNPPPAPDPLLRLLEGVRAGAVTIEDARRALAQRGEADAERSLREFATVDHDRARRCGFPEVVFCQGKTPAQAAAIAQEILRRSDRVLLTRAEAVQAAVPAAVYDPLARCLTVAPAGLEQVGEVAVVSAGTADQPVAGEAARTLEIGGNRVSRYADVGVAGLHRLLARLDEIRRANVIVVVAGMEGALPSVVGGLVDKPVVAVPTSVGYGAHLAGVAALLTMLNSCAAGIGVVNIDNGFGAGYLASQINRQSISRETASQSTPPQSANAPQR